MFRGCNGLIREKFAILSTFILKKRNFLPSLLLSSRDGRLVGGMNAFSMVEDWSEIRWCFGKRPFLLSLSRQTAEMAIWREEWMLLISHSMLLLLLLSLVVVVVVVKVVVLSLLISIIIIWFRSFN